MIWTLLWKRLPIHPLLYADSPIPSLCVIQIGESYRFHVYNSNYNKILKVIRSICSRTSSINPFPLKLNMNSSRMAELRKVEYFIRRPLSSIICKCYFLPSCFLFFSYQTTLSERTEVIWNPAKQINPVLMTNCPKASRFMILSKVSANLWTDSFLFLFHIYIYI